MAITDSDVLKYVGDPSACPYCGGGNLAIDRTFSFSSNASGRVIMHCRICNAKWNEVYRLTMIEELAEGSVAFQATKGLRKE